MSSIDLDTVVRIAREIARTYRSQAHADIERACETNDPIHRTLRFASHGSSVDVAKAFEQFAEMLEQDAARQDGGRS